MSDLTRRRIVFGLAVSAALLCFVPLEFLAGRPVVVGQVNGIAFVYESSNGIPGGFIAGSVEDALIAKKVEFHRLDKDTPFSDKAAESKWSPYIAAAGQALPSVVVNRGGKYTATKVDGEDASAVLSVVRKAVGQ